MLELAAAARLTVWGNAVLAGTSSLDEAAGAITAGDPPHRVSGLPGERSPVAMSPGLARLRVLGVDRFRLVLPTPGDASGLAGPAGFNQLAVAAGAAVLSLGSTDLGLLSPERASWNVYDVRPAPPSPLSVGEAERMLRQEVRECTEELLRLDVARSRPELAGLLTAHGRPAAVGLPPSHPQRAVHLLAMAQRLSRIVNLGAQDDGSAVSAAEIAMRSRVLDRLRSALRRATEAACNGIE